MIFLMNITNIFFYLIGQTVFKIISTMDETINEINVFKNIIEDLNEGVIMVSGKNKIEYVNNKFLIEFKSEIMKLYEDKYNL